MNFSAHLVSSVNIKYSLQLILFTSVDIGPTIQVSQILKYNKNYEITATKSMECIDLLVMAQFEKYLHVDMHCVSVQYWFGSLHHNSHSMQLET